MRFAYYALRAGASMSRERFPQTVPQATESPFLREAHWGHVAFEFGEHALSQFFYHRNCGWNTMLRDFSENE